MEMGTVYLVSQVLDLILLGVQLTAQARVAAESLQSKLRVFIDRGYPPTDEEWKPMIQETNLLLAQLHLRADEAKAYLDSGE